MIYIDSISLDAVKYLNYGFIKGLTTNPTIIERDKNTEGFIDTVKYLQEIPGEHFVQGSVKKDVNWFGLLKAKVESGEIDAKKFTIKLPWDPLLASKYVLLLKRIGFKVCATAVYTIQQTYTAIAADVDYVAIYYDRMQKSGINAEERLIDMLQLCEKNKPNLRILGASIKDVESANKLLKLGIHDLTLPLDVLKEYIKVNFPQNDLERFEDDFKL